MSLPQENGFEMAAAEVLGAYKAYQDGKPYAIIQEHIDEMTFIMASIGDDDGRTMAYIMEDPDPEQQEACAFVQGFTAGVIFMTFRNTKNANKGK